MEDTTHRQGKSDNGREAGVGRYYRGLALKLLHGL